MKLISIVLAVFAMMAGLIASYYWFRSAKRVSSAKDMIAQIKRIRWESELPGRNDKAELLEKAGQMQDNAWASDHLALRDNEAAALWTAASVVLGTVANLLGAVAR